jgi:predicted TPR repeat methyltransferase
MTTTEPQSSESAPPEAMLPAELSLDEALQFAIRLHQQDQFEAAKSVYQRILQIAPDHPDALCLLGVTEHKTGNSETALQLIGRAIELMPSFGGYHLNLGNVLCEMNKAPEALNAFGRALELDPGSADVHCNVGAIQRSLRRLDEAEASYARALKCDPEHMRTWNNIASLHDARGDIKASITALLKAIELSPGNALPVLTLGRLLWRAGYNDKAIEVYRQWMVRDPDNPVPAHLYAACSGKDVPQRASDSYVEAEFDGFAASFESVLNERLDYRAPQLCVDLLAGALGAATPTRDILDAGCGTGLCGPLVAPWARQLVGVDLSGGMLGKARTKGVYQQLIKAELTAYLNTVPLSWDAIVCADTLCYFGDLSDYMQAAAAALRPGGNMVFTVEALPDDADDGAKIQPHGRYAHGRAHLDRCIAEAGLTLLQARREQLRTEGGTPVLGWLMSVQRGV